jgi:amino acid transporter
MFASRVLFTLGRARLIAPQFGHVHPGYGSPSTSVLFVGIASAAAVLLGRGALLPIVSVAGICLAGAALLVCVGVIRYRRISPDTERPYRVPGGSVTAGLAAAICLWMVAWALIEPGLSTRVPLEWVVLGGWTALGALMWAFVGATRGSLSESERYRLVVGEIAKEPA